MWILEVDEMVNGIKHNTICFCWTRGKCWIFLWKCDSDILHSWEYEMWHGFYFDVIVIKSIT